jgi:hypothetical protein
MLRIAVTRLSTAQGMTLPLALKARFGHQQFSDNVPSRAMLRSMRKRSAPTRGKNLCFVSVCGAIASRELADELVPRTDVSQVGCSTHPNHACSVVLFPEQKMILQSFGSGHVPVVGCGDYRGKVSVRNFIQLIRGM